MSREIRFRAYIKPLKRYATGLDTIQFHKCCDVTGAGIWSVVTLNEGIFEADDIIIEQYTGLKDKNGKEIYEGDIVKRLKPHEFLKNVEETEIFRIRWGVRKAGFFAYSKERKKHNIPAKRLNEDDIYEVIGNIHENPELLGGEE